MTPNSNTVAAAAPHTKSNRQRKLTEEYERKSEEMAE